MNGIKSAISIPIIVRGMLIGVLNFFKINNEQPFTNSDMEFVSVLCGQAGIAIENAQLYEKVANSYMEIIATLANAIEVRDKYTAGHSIRMAEYCRSIAIKLGTPPNEVENIYTAALLHDIGKIGIPDSILLKIGPLSIDEYKTIKTHPDIGVKIICNLPDVEGICNIIRHHHERFDGYGYPDSLKGEEIPLGSRILFVADTFEAMTNLRPYREALSVTKAIEELKNCAGTQFDPKVVGTFIDILKEKKVSPELTKNIKSKGAHARTKS
ncbi:MAG: HD domain-containing phosphohydrolase [Nitrospinota bacterium]